MKKILKSRIFFCILVTLVFGIVGVSAATYFPSEDVTYDNNDSGLSSTDVQGAIDELYSTCSSSLVLGDYMFYANTRYSLEVYMYLNPYVIASGSYINKCDLDGNNCSKIVSNNGSTSINGIYITDDYMYYAVTGYTVTTINNVPSPYVISNGSTIFRCNLNGQSCSQIISQTGMVSIDNIYVNNNYIYYMMTSYQFYNYNNTSSYYIIPSGNQAYRCNLNGGSCTAVVENDGSISSNLFIK